MPRLIDADKLYEQTAEWEAQALSMIEQLNRTPLEEMDEVEKAEWRRWTAILNERSAFKHDVADAPTADVPERKTGNWVGIDDEPCEVWECDRCGYIMECYEDDRTNYCPNCGAKMSKEIE